MPGDAELIRGLGGAHAVARMLGLPQQTVQDWITRNTIPRKHHGALMEAAEKAGKALHPIDFFDPRWKDGTTVWQELHGKKRPRGRRAAKPADGEEPTDKKRPRRRRVAKPT